jgi:ABC-type Fe3+ transport system substrate-binding protein
MTDAPNPYIKALCKQLAKVTKERTDAQARIAPLEAALLVMVNHEVDYMDNNNLGDPEEQHRIKQARAALKP